jgi:1-acyl-sn-glycerol-3-phosphate acyltransferase
MIAGVSRASSDQEPKSGARRPAPLSLRQRLARALLRWSGWRLVGEAPPVSRCVIIFAPHTSSWDFPLLLAVRCAFGQPVAYLAKHTLFKFPFAGLLRRTGAIPVDRTERHALVSTLAQAFREREWLWLALSPEGTRDRTDHWKSGFYHVAREAGVPLLLAFIDARRRECGLGGLVSLTGDADADLARLRAFFSDKQGIVPERASDIRWRDPSDPE